MIVEKEDKGMIELDLTGEQGNVFFLLAQAKKLTRTLNEPLKWEDIRNDMTSGDYDHAVDVFEEHFGHLVILSQ
ncbi:MAG: hypothetical protein MUO40_07960 [Anaerolineaceae bacterium]|nr:hypothetical protein [Anaerolineaceae bacterium]